MSVKQQSPTWDWEISAHTSWLGTSLRELASYKELLQRMVRKEFLATYQQTLLGPLWAVIIPLLTVFTYVLVFNKIMGFATQGVPPLLYYLSGITLWNLFADSLLAIAPTFSLNAQVFTKVYFPRIIVPLSVMALQMIRFGIQLLILIIIAAYYAIMGKVSIPWTGIVYALPAMLLTAGLAFGIGLIFSIITAKYRDLLAMLQFGIRLFMFFCPIFYAYNTASQKYAWLIALNPLSVLFEWFRYAFTGKGYLGGSEFLYSAIVTVVLLGVGLLIFNKRGDKLIDFV